MEYMDSSFKVYLDTSCMEYMDSSFKVYLGTSCMEYLDKQDISLKYTWILASWSTWINRILV